MALTRITDATVEPVTLAEAKAHLRVTVSDEDALITALIQVARQACEDRLQRALLEQTWKLTLDAFSEAIPLPRPPALSITSVQYVDAAGAVQTLAPSEYSLDADPMGAWLVPAWGASWPATRDQVGAVTVTWKAGYGTAAAAVPAPIRQWILLAIGEMYEQREAGADKARVPSTFVDGLLDTYRVWGV